MVYSCGVFLTEPSCCYTAHWLDRPPTLSTTSHAVPPPARASTSAYYCPDCTAARLYHHADWPPPPEVEPSAPPLASAADAPDAGDVDADATAAPALGRRRSSPPARCYRYIPSSSSSSFRQGRSSVGRGGGSRSSYFRSMVPGGDAFPVPPPAYDDS